MRISLENQAASYKLVISSAKLKAQLPAGTALALAELMSGVNCYYSNLIENIEVELPNTKLQEAAHAKHDPRGIQDPYLAHLAVQDYLADKTSSGQHPFRGDIIGESYAQYSALLPPDQIGHGAIGQPNADGYRGHGVRVGAHIAPAPEAIPGLMLQFER